MRIYMFTFWSSNAQGGHTSSFIKANNYKKFGFPDKT